MPSSSGHLVVIGGHEDKTKERLILRRFVELAGGKQARLVVLAAASTETDAMRNTYETAFTEIGVKECRILALDCRQEANDPAQAQTVGQATGIFMTGGAQNRLMSIIGGSAIEAAMDAAFYGSGAVIAGTSAGGAAMSEPMIVEGIGQQSTQPEKGMLSLGVGLGFLNRILIDTHFAERGRIYRLLATIAANPHILGAGIDENTAMLIQPNRSLEIIGEGVVTVLDGRNNTLSNINEVARGDLLSLINMHLNVLAAGFRYTLDKKNDDAALKGLPDDATLRELVTLLTCSLQARHPAAPARPVA